MCQSIETDETAKKPDQIKMSLSSEEEREAIAQLEQAITTNKAKPGIRKHIGHVFSLYLV